MHTGRRIASRVVGCASLALLVIGAFASVTDCGLSSEDAKDCDAGGCPDGLVSDPDIGVIGGGRCQNPSDPLHPPAACGPLDEVPHNACNTGALAPYKDCPTDTACMARKVPTGDNLAWRIGKFRMWSPKTIVPLAGIVVDAKTNPTCYDSGQDSFNFLMTLNKKTGDFQLGGSHPSPDGKTYQFLKETVDATSYKTLCPAFVPHGAASFDLAPTAGKMKVSGNSFESDPASPMGLVAMPIFQGKDAVILPIRNGTAQGVTFTADGTCIGAWDSHYACLPDSGGWTTGGQFTGQITLEDADNLPVYQSSCRTLCAILAGTEHSTGSACTRGADGKIPEIGDSCADPKGTCKDSYTLTVTFAAYAVDVLPPPP